jgi:hypothetical protein
MSEEDEDRQASFQIVSEKGGYGPVFRIQARFLGITLVIRWNDTDEDVRSEIRALLRDTPELVARCFNEIDIVMGARDIDAEWERYSLPAPLEEDE